MENILKQGRLCQLAAKLIEFIRKDSDEIENGSE